MSEKSDYKIEFIDPNKLVGFVDESSDTPDDVIEETNPQDDLEISKEVATDYIIKKQEDTRGRLAILYTIFTFVIFILGFIAAVIDGLLLNKSIIESISALFPLISGIFLGTLGFVLGYYFKKSEEK